MNSFGRLFRIEILGESHGNGVGVVIDGVPPGMKLNQDDFTADMKRRQGGTQKGTTPRKESDLPQIQTGWFEGHTTGAPLLLWIANENVISRDYSEIKYLPRPGHADFVAYKRSGGWNDYRGGGHFSGRLTAALVAAGAVAKKLLPSFSISAAVMEVGGATDYAGLLDKAVENGDSLGGLVECKVSGVPIGLGEPFFDSLESLLAHAVFAIPAIKGIEFGSGFAAARMKGSEHNDDLLDSSGKTATNRAGGIQGGLSNGNEIVFRIAVKPTSSIKVKKNTIDIRSGAATQIEVAGRHDACIALRVPPVLEAVTACVLADLHLLHTAASGHFADRERR